ncbi:uncharacterized protein NKAPD1 isoform X1 [Pleurodeles waltl]
MSRIPLGKVLLRNVIRHTDAHNKIQEESEMWKIRELEKHTKEIYETKQSRTSLDNARWDHSGYKELYPEEFEPKKTRMRCDGFDGDVQRQPKTKSLDPVASEKELRKVRSLNKRFYECEASIPERWGHSGYKELYPEEFDTDSDELKSAETVNGKKASRLRRGAEQESRKRKRSKKSHKKKQKKRSHKKLKKRKKEEPVESSTESESSDESTSRAKKVKRKKKTRKKPARKPPSSSGQDSDSSDSSDVTDSSSATSEADDKKQTKSHKKRHHRSKARKDFESQEKKSKRKNWKVANDDRSDSSDDD